MATDSPPESAVVTHSDLLIQRLSRLDIPRDKLNLGPRGIVEFARSNRSLVGQLVSAILPAEEEVDTDTFHESEVWLQWLMFEDEPQVALEQLEKMSDNERGVCGAVWGNNDIAYRCRTCEHDPTCAICVPCFENGNHKDHDYSVIYTGGGCCDCGDITAWKREGFCSKHKGAEQIQPLPKHVAESLGPVLDSLLIYWKEKLLSARNVSEQGPRVVGHAAEKCAEELTSSVVGMLLDFCKHSESLLSFISQRVYYSAGLLDVLLRSERFMNANVVAKLQELLLKMLGEPIFKYEFSKVFVLYYPCIVTAAINEGTDTALKKYPLLSTFSVQILTVPTLTPRLVEEMNLLGMLLQCLGSIFTHCSDEDGKLLVNKWAHLYETTIRVVEDIRFVMSHSVVPNYLCQRRRDLVRVWMRLLASVQGMNTQKRETGSHVEDENENVHLPFALCHSISSILSLQVAGAFSVSVNDDNKTFISMYKQHHEDQDSLRHAKVGRLSQESSVSSTTVKGAVGHEVKAIDSFPVPSSALWLVYECLRSLESWLGLDNTLGPLNALSLKTSDGSGNNFLALKRTLSRFRRGRHIFKSSTSSGFDSSQPVGQLRNCGTDDNIIEGESSSEPEGLRVLSLSDWPDITYDVGSQEISVHIPLHRLLSMLLRRALKESFGEGSLRVLSTDSVSADHSFVRHGDFLCQILDGSHPYGFSSFVMEHPLRIRVFCAQVHAGMWRSNGDAPLLFSEWYRAVRWSEQGQEPDLFLLQCCAALAPPDLFVQRILERFGLSNYITLNTDQSSEHEPTLVTEMLTLLIQIVKERRFCGLTTAECLQRELVYKLAIGDATRSQLVKSLPRDLSEADEFQEVLDRVAEYSHPSGMTQGMYKLRSSYWKDLDLYHPRWNLRDQQAAEERYLLFCNVSAMSAQLPRWTKIYPPLRGIAKIATCKTLLQIVRAVLFYGVFSDKLATPRALDGVLLTALHLLALALDVCRLQKELGDPFCYVGDIIPVLAFASEEIPTSKYGDQSLLSILVILMRTHEKENAQNFMEAGDFNLSSVVMGLIKAFVALEPACMTKLQKLAPQLANKFSKSISNDNASDMDLSDCEKRKAKSRERQTAILEKMRAQQSKFLESFNSSKDDEMEDANPEQEVCDSEVSNDTQESAQVTCSLCHDPKSKNPVSYLVLLQKSRLLSLVEHGPPLWDRVSRSGKELVLDDKTPINILSQSSVPDSSEVSLSQFKNMVQSALNDFASTGQPQEVNAFTEYVKAQFPTIKNIQLPSVLKDTRESKTSSFGTLEQDMYLSIRRFQSSTNGSDSRKDAENCSTTGSSSKRSGCSESLLFGKYMAGLSKEPQDNPLASQNGSCSDWMKLKSGVLHPGYDNFRPTDADGIYVSSCGHAVHKVCLDRYLSSLRERFNRRIVFEGGHIVDPEQGEFLCPVCRGLANSVLPVLPGDKTRIPQPSAGSTINFTGVSSHLNFSATGHSLRLQDALSLLQTAANIAGDQESLKIVPTRKLTIKPNLEPIIRLLCAMYYPKQAKILETGRVSHPLIIWDTLKYSLISAEIAARSRKNSLSPNYSIGSLYKELQSSSGFILSLLLDVTQSTKTTPQAVLLRFQGIQLFAKSLMPGTNPNGLSSFPTQHGDTMLYILENAELEAEYPDIQLWRQAHEPIIAHDAFSSFMWTLFCLPWPMLSCKESYLSLVHVFYVVSITQAILACYSTQKSIQTEVEVSDNLMSDIHRLIGKHQEAMKFFKSNLADSSHNIYDSIRILTFPYLRRCALLWKLINSSSMMPFGDEAHAWDRSPCTLDDMEYVTNVMEELLEVGELEKMFDIPTLDIIINDEVSRSTASRWVGHFCEVFEAHKSSQALRCTPAVPFKLMLLPHVYHDLLQRYFRKCCPACGVLMEEPALCLLCGTLCSPNWKTCCRASTCKTHALDCGAGIGVFLLIRRTTILLQRSARQAPWPSPYLDAFGEEDVEMHRGKPLFLSQERYAALTHMVASHGLDRSSKVLRQTTIGSFFMF
ncbi:E3 ubiquitin-protein ligase PRT6-like isoform X1 [Salvia splendens]|uniref:E3 ubiquitin-protein ligase PRT6-like isoform X1 n=1 Tax=Salvia splendens TaxID=180675 RepID=UPI001C26B53C|nr:E3 ubiquitin-protein ligase PRT6-like isoform X1 [Salvia splendens]